jgi:arylsulfatase A-like enzyme
MQVDSSVGAVLSAIDDAGIKDRTLVIFTSDNGCSPQARIEELRGKGHDPCAGFRGTKADIWEGGHRVPFLARWPGTIKGGSATDALICLTDILATCAEITGARVAETAAEDSISFLPALRGEKGRRDTLISHSIAGHFAIRRDNLKLCLTPGSGGWSAPKPGSAAEKDLPAEQLFDLQADPGESKNLAAEKPDAVRELTALLEEQVRNGRSTPGAPQKNAVEVKIRKRAK